MQVKQVMAPVMGVLVAASVIFGASGPAGAKSDPVDPNTCGGLDQKPCTTSAAEFLGKVHAKKPDKHAFLDPRKGGEWWKCPHNRPRRTLHSVTSKKACATKKVIGEKLAHAEFLGKAKNKKPGGAFVDPRNGGEYWKCPKGFFRNLEKVTSHKACTVDPGKDCDGNLIAVGDHAFAVSGLRCVKKNACGKKGERPCLVVERVPSCNKGLAEDFIANTCIDHKLAKCLTMVRSVRYASGVLNATGKAAETVEKALIKELEKVPGFKKVEKGIKQIDKQVEKVGKAISKKAKPITNTLEKEFAKNPGLQSLAEHISTINDAAHQNKKKLTAFLSSDDFCTMKTADRRKKFRGLLNQSGKDSVFETAAHEDPTALEKLRHALDALIPIRAAHAAKTTGESVWGDTKLFFLAGPALQVTIKHVGISVDLHFALSMLDGDDGLILGVGPVLTSAKGKSGDKGKTGKKGKSKGKNIDVSAGVNLGLAWGKSLKDVAGPGFGFGFTFLKGGKSKVANAATAYGIDIVFPGTIFEDIVNGKKVTGEEFIPAGVLWEPKVVSDSKAFKAEFNGNLSWDFVVLEF